MAKILVIDDEQAVINLYNHLLSKKGFKVLTATNGEDGLSIAEKELPDLILLDVMMPGMDGGAVAQNLLENQRTKNIPIIFFSSLLTKEEETEDDGRIGKRFFISKSSSIEEILRKINDVLGIGT